MSSLSATQADGYYAPPEYFDSGQYKKKSRNQAAGSSKGHNQYLQNGVVRFELPYNAFCIQCGAYVSRGARFNAKKETIGAYLTSPIYEFRMKCRICAAVEFVIRTNPKERGFDYVSGIHKQVQDFNTAAARIAGVIDTKDGNRLVGSADRNSLEYLDTIAKGKRKSATEWDALDNRMRLNNKTYGQDVTCNSKIRRIFRQDRKEKKDRLKKRAKLGWAEGMEVLRDDRLEDVITAKSTTFSDGKASERKKFRGLRTGSIFNVGVEKRKIEKDPAPDVTLSRDWRTGGRSKQHFKVKEEAHPDTIASHDETLDSSQFQTAAVKKKKRLVLKAIGASVSIVCKPSLQPTSMLEMLADYGSDSD